MPIFGNRVSAGIISYIMTRSSWIRVGPRSHVIHTPARTAEGKRRRVRLGKTGTQRENTNGCRSYEPEKLWEVMSKRCWPPRESGDSEEGSSPRASGENMARPSPALRLLAPGTVRQHRSAVSVNGPQWQEPRETNAVISGARSGTTNLVYCVKSQECNSSD